MESETKIIKLSPEDLEFLATYTNTHKEVVEEVHNEFLDTYPDGKVTKDGFKRMMQKLVSELYLFLELINITFWIPPKTFTGVVFKESECIKIRFFNFSIIWFWQRWTYWFQRFGYSCICHFWRNWGRKT